MSDNGFVFSLGISTATASVLIMVLYLTFDASKRDFYGNPYVLWVLPVILFLWVTRVWFVGHRGELHDDPVTFALKDRQSLILGGIIAAAFVLSLAPPL